MRSDRGVDADQQLDPVGEALPARRARPSRRPAPRRPAARYTRRSVDASASSPRTAPGHQSGDLPEGLGRACSPRSAAAGRPARRPGRRRSTSASSDHQPGLSEMRMFFISGLHVLRASPARDRPPGTGMVQRLIRGTTRVHQQHREHHALRVAAERADQQHQQRRSRRRRSTCPRGQRAGDRVGGDEEGAEEQRAAEQVVQAPSTPRPGAPGSDAPPTTTHRGHDAGGDLPRGRAPRRTGTARRAGRPARWSRRASRWCCPGRAATSGAVSPSLLERRSAAWPA